MDLNPSSTGTAAGSESLMSCRSDDLTAPDEDTVLAATDQA